MLTANQIQISYQLLCEHSSDVFILCDTNFQILEFNSSAEKYFGLPKKDVIGRDYLKVCNDCGISSLFPNDLTELYTKCILSNIKSNKIVDGFQNIFNWTILNMRYPVKHESFGFILLGKNVTNLTKDNHREKLDFYLNAIISKLPGNFYWKNTESIYQGCAEDLLKTAGLRREMVVGKTDEDLWPPDVAKKLTENDRIALMQDSTLQTVESILSNSEEEQHFIAVKMPLKDLFGETMGIIGNSIDITDQIRAETQLKKEQENLKVANQAKMEFLLNIRHDLRTPFSGILGFSKYLRERESNPIKKEQLGYIEESSATLLKMIDEIFDSFRIEHDLNVAVVEHFSIDEVISTVSKIFITAVKDKGLEFKHNYDPNIPKLLSGDRSNILRMLINLVGNAIKFTEKGTIILSVNQLGCQQNESTLEFRIEDTGIGISPEKHEFIFEKFAKVKPSYEGRHHGIGLGLSVVKEIVETLGGKIQVKSTLGIGSIFYCTLTFKIPFSEHDAQKTVQETSLLNNSLTRKSDGTITKS